ncbi:beta-galactosidase [Anaerocolumna sedimenticola]|uniref:beta-galactosidase n=1 Tax=Anaerocolumna sedimenticola TaxID=2696063 RepID=UPI001FE768CC|nr:beta-galactosidase [Anaerocolumna sedimenticola]
MTDFSFNPRYLTKDKKPWFPIMGEMHYSRYPKKYWRDSLYKMKAGGVDIVSTYAIWIHHEEIEGVYDFEGDKDLRTFAKTCKECGLYMILRVGPWIHGEVRNGGFPDWILKKGFEPRTNDPAYFQEVRKYYSKIYEQVEGLLLKDGGSIIGLQIENEYGHCGGLDGEAGELHMSTLHQMVKEIGFDVPLYTATGWGGAVTGGLLPVMGGYPEAPWDQRLTEIEPSGNYIFTHERNDHNIGSDYGFGTGITYDLDKFPYLTAELGGGMQVTHHRRPVAYASDIGAISLVKLGSGVNLLGYYMYHGGTNPKGNLTTLQETRATGYPNDLPEFNYDFRAPIGEYGQITETFKELKLFAMFIRDFGSELCEMNADIPKSNPLYPGNFTDLRTSVRHNGRSGYIFVNNYQRRYPVKNHTGVNLKVDLENESLHFPSIDIKDKDYFFFPFNMKIGNAVLKTALATPLCILDNETKVYIYYSNHHPQYNITGDLGDNKIVTISREDAKNAWKVNLDKEYLIISNSAVIKTEKEIEIIGRGDAVIKVYPAFTPVNYQTTYPANYLTECLIRNGFEYIGRDGDFTVYKKKIKHLDVNVRYECVADLSDKKVYEINLDYAGQNLADCYLQISYAGIAPDYIGMRNVLPTNSIMGKHGKLD